MTTLNPEVTLKQIAFLAFLLLTGCNDLPSSEQVERDARAYALCAVGQPEYSVRGLYSTDDPSRPHYSVHLYALEGDTTHLMFTYAKSSSDGWLLQNVSD